MQQNNLKALSVAVLQRNQHHNKSATKHEKPRNNSTEKQPPLLRDAVPLLHSPTTFDQALDALNSLGNWTQTTELAEILCPELLEATKQADRDVDNHIIGLAQYYQTWRDLYLATRKGLREDAH